MTTPAAYPSELEGHIVLPNRRRIRIRPLRRCERDTIRELYDRLSPRTRYRRFFSPMATLPEYVVSMLACVDYGWRLALVAEHETGNGREIVGLASFGATDEGRAEVALVVHDDWQGQRLGTELADRLLRAAEARGFHRFNASVQSDNLAIQRLMRNLGDVVSTKTSGGISEFGFTRRRTPHEDG